MRQFLYLVHSRIINTVLNVGANMSWLSSPNLWWEYLLPTSRSTLADISTLL